MRFSVITPTHDPRWLGEAWESLQQQARLIHGASDYFGSVPDNGRLFEMFVFDMDGS